MFAGPVERFLKKSFSPATKLIEAMSLIIAGFYFTVKQAGRWFW